MKNNVYIILYTLSVGGAERHASSIANYLGERGFNVNIVLLQDNVVNYYLQENVRVTALPKIGEEMREPTVRQKMLLKVYGKFSNKRYERLDREIFIHNEYLKKLDVFFSNEKSIKDSLVISFMPHPNICASKLSRKYGYKLILGEFNSPQLEFSEDAPENYFKKKYYMYANGFVFQTEEQKEFYSYLDKKVRMTIIPNPIEPIGVKPYSGIRKKEIVNYCRLSKAKNLPLLIDAFYRIALEYPEYHLTIYGDGPLRSEIEKYIEDHHLSAQVSLKPFSTNVLSLVNECAMFVSSSDREGISNSMIEAMAIGLPTICTDCPAGGARMFIKSYDNGILTPVGDAESLYNAMKYMINNPEKAEQMGRKAVIIREILNKEKILSQWFEFIEETLEQ